MTKKRAVRLFRQLNERILFSRQLCTSFFLCDRELRRMHFCILRFLIAIAKLKICYKPKKNSL